MNATKIGHAIIKGLFLTLMFCGLAFAADTENVSIIISSDTMGHLEICRECGPQIQQGGMACRATLVQDFRKKDRSLLLLDAGNVFFGPDSMESQGKVMVAAYNALGYDAVNLSFRDFRLGKESSLSLLQEAQFPILSANLLDEETSAPLAKPYVIKKIGGLRIAMIGVTQRLARLDYLSHLKEQLAGIRIQLPLEALEHWLPKPRAEADWVILLYYGSAAGLEPIREKFTDEFTAILVGDSWPEYLPTNTIPPIVGIYDKGQYLAKVQLTDTDEKLQAKITQIAVEPSLAPSPEIETVLASFKMETPSSVSLAAKEAETSTGDAWTIAQKEDAEPSGLIIGETLRLGIPITEAMTLFGMPQGMRTEGKGEKEIRWMEYPDLGVSIGAKPGGKNIEFIEVQRAFRGRLRSGVKIGDSQTAVITNYGMPESMTPESLSYPTEGIIFRFADGKLIGARVSKAAVKTGVSVHASEKASAKPMNESEPNDVRESADELRLGGTAEGLLQKEYDKDWYRLDVDVPGRNIIRFDFNGLPEVEGGLSLYDSQGTLLKKIGGGKKGAPVTLANWGVKPGTYYIQVVAWSGQNPKAKYRLSVKYVGPWKEGLEFEPNDTREKAGVLMLDSSVEGLIQFHADKDWYRLDIDVPEKILVAVELSGVPDVTSTLELYDQDGNQIARTGAQRRGDPQLITNWGVEKGTYYVKVDQSSGTNINDNYLLRAKMLGPWNPGIESEPNNQRAIANPLDVGQKVEGRLQTMDIDWYRVTVSAPGRSLLRLDFTGAQGLDKLLRLYDGDGNELLEADASVHDASEHILNYGVAEGDYFVAVNTRGVAPGKSQQYILHTKLTPWKQGMEVEPNNDQDHASTISLNQVDSGFLDSTGGDDWYEFTIPTPGFDILTVELSAIADADSQLTLFDVKGNTLKDVNHQKIGGKEQIVQLRIAPEKYYIRVNSYQGSNTQTPYELWVGEPRSACADEEALKRALKKALGFLADTQRADGSWPSPWYKANPGIAGLALLAFVGAESLEIDYARNIEMAINHLRKKYHPSSDYKPASPEALSKGGLIGKQSPMYEHAIALLGLIETFVYRKDLSLRPMIKDALALTVRTQNIEHKPKALGGPVLKNSPHYGGWRYQTNSTDSDIGITGWHVLALKAAVNSGFRIPDWSLPAASDYVRRCYHPDKEPVFWYQTTASAGWHGLGSGSCTQTAIGALVLQLASSPGDKLILPSLEFLQKNPPQWEIEDPGEGFPFYYWYYGTRTMLISGGDNWRSWKNWMCTLLTDNQNPDGSWPAVQREERVGIAYTTALGALILELCLGHVPVYMAAEPFDVPSEPEKPGNLQIIFSADSPGYATQNVELILDASRSMWGQIKGRSKISIASEVLGKIIQELPEKMNVGLRVYGHKYKVNDKRACTDTELMVPIRPLAKQDLINYINRIKPRGKTPLVYAVLQAAKDFEQIAKGSIILISDGIESCDGDIQSIARELKKSGFDLIVHIVGFSIKEAKAREELQAIATSTGGTYLDAKDPRELLASLRATLQVEYVLLDDQGQEIARGVVGGPQIQAKAGPCTLRVLLKPESLEKNLIIRSEDKLILTLRKDSSGWSIE